MAGLKVVCTSNKAIIPNVGVDDAVLDNQSLMDLVVGKVYEVTGEKDGWYRIVDESGEDYWYPKDYFELAGDADV